MSLGSDPLEASKASERSVGLGMRLLWHSYQSSVARDYYTKPGSVVFIVLHMHDDVTIINSEDFLELTWQAYN